MKFVLRLILAFVVIQSCAPASYINNVPKSSMLKEEGDLLVRAGFGLDNQENGSNIQYGAAWSPIKGFGIEAEYSGSLLMNFDDFYTINGSLINYIPFENGSNLELKLGYGVGAFDRKKNFVELDCNGPSCIVVPFYLILDDGYVVSTKHRTVHGQVNYNFYDQSDDIDLSFGCRVRSIQF